MCPGSKGWLNSALPAGVPWHVVCEGHSITSPVSQPPCWGNATGLNSFIPSSATASCGWGPSALGVVSVCTHTHARNLCPAERALGFAKPEPSFALGECHLDLFLISTENSMFIVEHFFICIDFKFLQLGGVIGSGVRQCGRGSDHNYRMTIAVETQKVKTLSLLKRRHVACPHAQSH